MRSEEKEKAIVVVIFTHTAGGSVGPQTVRNEANFDKTPGQKKHVVLEKKTLKFKKRNQMPTFLSLQT